MADHCSCDMALVPLSVRRSMYTSRERNKNVLYPARFMASSLSGFVSSRMGSTILILNGGGMTPRDFFTTRFFKMGDMRLFCMQLFSSGAYVPTRKLCVRVPLFWQLPLQTIEKILFFLFCTYTEPQELTCTRCKINFYQQHPRIL